MPDVLKSLIALAQAHPLIGACAALGVILYVNMMISGPRAR